MSALPEENIEIEVKEGDILAGKYRVEKVLGAGGMGVVVAATHTVLNDRVALKFLLPQVAQHETTAARFLREAQAAVKIKSPHVARVIDVGTMEDTGSPYMVMEFLEGKDLSHIIESEGPLDTPLACLYALQTCEALAAAHSNGIVHRDIKPANMFVTLANDGMPVIKVLDFGISKVTSDLGVSSLTQTQVSMGSPLYMSPEQMRSARDVDHRADIWSLGVVLYEMLTGTLPFMADSMPQLCALVLENTAPPMRLVRPDLPEGLEPIVARCLAKNLEERYSTISELATALGPFAGEAGIASAAKTTRIMEGAFIGKRTVSGVEMPRRSLSSLPEASSLTHATHTSFGRTGGTDSEGTKKGTSPLVFVAAAAVVLGLGGGAFALMGGGGEEPAAAAPAAPTVDRAKLEADALKAAEAKVKGEFEEREAKKQAEEDKRKAEDEKKAEEEAKKAEEEEKNKEPSAMEKKWWAAGQKKKQASEKKETPPPDDGSDVFDTRK